MTIKSIPVAASTPFFPAVSQPQGPKPVSLLEAPPLPAGESKEAALAIDQNVIADLKLPLPSDLAPVFRTQPARLVDAETRRLSIQLRKAVDAGRWGEATDLIQQMDARAKANPEARDANNEMHALIGYALGKAEDQNAWHFLDFLLAFLTLGGTAIADAIDDKPYEKTLDAARATRTRIALPIAERIVSSRFGGNAEDAAMVAKSIAEHVPPSVLRVVEMQGSRFFAVKENVFGNMNVDVTPYGMGTTASSDEFGSNADGTMKALGPDTRRVNGAYDFRTNEGNIVVDHWLVGGPKLAAADAAVHEVVHAYDDAVNESSSPAFLKALAQDDGKLPDDEYQKLRMSAECFAEYGTAYLMGDHSMAKDKPALYAYFVATFGPR